MKDRRISVIIQQEFLCNELWANGGENQNSKMWVFVEETHLADSKEFPEKVNRLGDFLGSSNTFFLVAAN